MSVRALSLAFIVLWIMLGLYFMLEGLKLQLGSISSPGTGFMPFLIGVAVIGFGIMSAIPLLASVPASDSKRLTIQRFRDPAIVVVSMIAYSLALERIGFIVSTGVLIVFLTWFVGRTTFLRATVSGAIATLVCYVVFGLLLGVRLP
jgi:putative tricarboxylic transport membrane protein